MTKLSNSLFLTLKRKSGGSGESIHQKRIIRMLRLLVYLQSERPCSVDEIGKKMGVCKRTIFRDIRLLNSAGFEFIFDHDNGRYIQNEPSQKIPLQLSKEECLALMFVTQKLITPSLFPDYENLKNAAMKIESSMSSSNKKYCYQMLSRMASFLPPHSDSDTFRDIYDLCKEAIYRNHKLMIWYERFSLPLESELTVHPYHLVFSRKKWLLVGFVERICSIRHFHLDRIVRINKLLPKFLENKLFSIYPYFKHSWALECTLKQHLVILKFYPPIAYDVEEIDWQHSQVTYWENNCLYLEIVVNSLNEVSHWVRGYGRYVEIIKPEELYNLIQENNFSGNR